MKLTDHFDDSRFKIEASQKIIACEIGLYFRVSRPMDFANDCTV